MINLIVIGLTIGSSLVFFFGMLWFLVKESQKTDKALQELFESSDRLKRHMDTIKGNFHE